MTLTVSTVPSTGTMRVAPWVDSLIDRLGLDPRSAYVETFWLGTLGPSTTWLLRRLVQGLDTEPQGYDLDLASCAREIGLGDKGGRHSPFARSLGRLVQFDIARWQPSDGTLEVRRRVPPLNRRQVMHLPEALQARHEDWQARQLDAPPAAAVRRRCRSLALALVDTGEERENAERQLLNWGYHPALCYESTAWAVEELTRIR
jgi:hypothetical protein